jgi:DNA-binding NtrC family response regulator
VRSKEDVERYGGKQINEVKIDIKGFPHIEKIQREKVAIEAMLAAGEQAIKKVKSIEGYGDILYASKEMEDVLKRAEKAASSDASIIILGETGVGKEAVARLIHKRSKVSKGPFVDLNCGGLPKGLLESELFGHKRGAFSGAITDKPGLVETADNGTLFLDEIGDMPLEMQAKFLRFLQTGEFRRLSETKNRKAKVRIIAATNKDLEEEVKRGNFRKDLWYRISVVQILIPPLRKRKEDIEILAKHFLKLQNQKEPKKRDKILSQEAIAKLKSYNWPGNVRELENVIKNAYIFSEGNEIKDITLREIGEKSDRFKDLVEHFFDDLKSMNVKEILDSVKKQWYIQAIKLANGNKTQAARNLGINPRTFRKQCEALGL